MLVVPSRTRTAQCHGGDQRSGREALVEMSLCNQKPNVLNIHTDHTSPPQRLLTFGTDFETITAGGAVVYQQASSFIGLIYKQLVNRLENPLVISLLSLRLQAREWHEHWQYLLMRLRARD